MSGLGRDVRYAFRGLWRQRGFSAAALFMLSLGIAASCAMFAVVEAVVLKMPFADPDRVVTIHARDAEGDVLRVPFERLQPWAAATDVFEAVAAYTLSAPVFTDGEAATRLQMEALTPSMFQVLGVQPMLGRPFRKDDGRVVVLSHAFWRSRLNGDPAMLGRTIELDGVATVVVGVMPPAFEGPRSRPGDGWVPLSAPSDAAAARTPVSVLARLRNGVEPQQARARVEAIPWDARGPSRWTASVATAREDFLYVEAMVTMRILVGAVALVLLMACVNVASLLLGRNISRRRELAVRLAIGASRWQIMRQVAIEGLVLSAGAAAAGLVLAWWCVSAVAPLIPLSFPRVAQIRVDMGVAGFAALAAIVTGLAASMGPAWSASRHELSGSLKSGDRGAAGDGRRVRTALIVVEATLAMVVLTAAALMIAAFLRLNPTNPGFEIADRTKFSVRFDGPRYADAGARVAAVNELVTRLSAIPGVAAATSVTSLPLTGSTGVYPLRVTGVQETGRPPTVHFRAALPDYLSFMGMPMLSGRGLAASDTPAAQPVAVVNEAFVGRMLRGIAPIGASVVIDEPDGAVTRTIVGVVRDARIFGTDLRPRPEIFVPYAQSPIRMTSFVIRTATTAHGPITTDTTLTKITKKTKLMLCALPGLCEPRGLPSAVETTLEPGIRRAVGGFDATLPIERIQTLSAIAERSVNLQRFFAVLMGTFAAVAVGLAFVGLYAVSMWSVTQRTREIGVRLALGATPADVRRLVLRYGAAVGAVGAIAGVAVALASARVIESYLSGLPARQPVMFALLAIAFVFTVSLASYIPARRAMRVDPMEALRAE